MDGGYLESGDWLHEGQRWVQALLRGADVQPPASDGQGALQERFSPCAARGRVDHPVRLALTSSDLRQLDERPVPKGRAALVHPASLQGDDGLPASHIPNPDEAPRDCGRAYQSTQLAEERVAWNQRREREGRFAHSTSSEHSRSHKVPLGPIPRLPLTGIHWIIVGGESGPECRPMEPDWVRTIRNRCLERGVPFFFKQWGGVNKKKSGRTLDGRTWNELPPRPQNRITA